MPTAFSAVSCDPTKSPAGLLLAAGVGGRMGTPKALVDDWLRRGIDVLTAAGCTRWWWSLERHYTRRGNFCTAGRSLWRLPRTGATA